MYTIDLGYYHKNRIDEIELENGNFYIIEHCFTGNRRLIRYLDLNIINNPIVIYFNGGFSDYFGWDEWNSIKQAYRVIENVTSKVHISVE